MDLCQKVNKIIDVSALPQEVHVSDKYDVAFVSSVWDPEFSYISDPLSRLMVRAYGGSTAELADVGLSQDGKHFSAYESVKVEFNGNTVAQFYEKTGLHFFLLSFSAGNSIFIGLDLDFVLIVSEKETGFIAANGGKNMFRRLNWEVFNSGKTGMDEKIFRALDHAVYGASEGA